MPEPESDAQLPPAEIPADAHAYPNAPETPRALEIDIDPEPVKLSRAELLALRRRRTRQVGALAGVVWVLAACVLVLGFVRHRGRHEIATAKPSPPPPTAAAPSIDSPPPAPHLVAAIDDATATASALPRTAARRGEIAPPPSAVGHRIYVDGRVVGEGTAPVDVSCGDHRVRIGSRGQWRSVRVPCGSILTLR